MNLLLRFCLEIGALTGLGIASWNQSQGAVQWVAVVAVPLAAATLWGTFNVLDDPSRSGEAPVEVRGWIRLSVEVLVLGAGSLGYLIAGYPIVGVAFAGLCVVHYGIGRARLSWLLSQ